MARRAFEQTGLIPRSIIRTFDRFRKQLFKGGKTAVIQEFRVSRYQIIVSVKCLISLILIPLLVNFLARTYFLKPLTEYLWNTQQTEIFLNGYQENRAFSELHDFEEKLFFESLLETEPVPEQDYSHEKLETKKNQFDAFWKVNKANDNNERLSKTPVKHNNKVLHVVPKTLKSGSKNGTFDPFFLQTFTNQNLNHKNVFTENIQQKMTFPDSPLVIGVEEVSSKLFKENDIETGRLLKNKSFSYKKEDKGDKGDKKDKGNKKDKGGKGDKGDAVLSKHLGFPCSSKKDQGTSMTRLRLFECLKQPCFLPTQTNTFYSNQSLFFSLREKRNNKEGILSLNHPRIPSYWYKEREKTCFLCLPSLAHPSLSYRVDQSFSDLCEKELKSKVVDKKQPFYLENSLTQKFQQKTIELAIYYNQQSIQAIINFFGDLFIFFTISFLFVWMEPQIIILKSFLLESIYSFSDTTKSFLLILLTDLLVGFHSPHGWEILLEIILRHLGLPESQNFIFVFVATFPVVLDTLFKYWIFRFLNRISPSTVVTYHNMIE